MHRRNDPASRPVVAASLGCHLEGVCLPHVDPNDIETTRAGVEKRFGTKAPDPDLLLMAEFRQFVIKFCKDHLKPLPPDSDTTVESWLANTSYTQRRKEELLKKWELLGNPDRIFDKKYTECKSFVKDEFYPDFKHARAINSRTDEFKCAVGPIFKLIEKKVFALDYFIKKIPVSERPKYIMDMLARAGYEYDAADYTSFESLFTAPLMEACEMELYDYMTQELPEHEYFMKACRTVLAGENVCVFKDLTARVEAVRMSGEMCTSLGNGFSNLMFCLFLNHKYGDTRDEPYSKAVVIEGDDSLASRTGVGLEPHHFAKLGLIIKMEHHLQVSEASFCGLVFDEDDLVNVTNPLEVLATTGWCTSQYARSTANKKRALLRCKALSIAHQYPGCPILSSFAQYLLRVTRGQDVRHMVANWRNTYEREQLIDALRDEKKIKHISPPINTRLLVERLYSIPVERQMILERYFNSCEEIKPIPLWFVDDLIPMSWRQFFCEYSEVRTAQSNFSYPTSTWTRKYEYQFGLKED